MQIFSKMFRNALQNIRSMVIWVIMRICCSPKAKTSWLFQVFSICFISIAYFKSKMNNAISYLIKGNSYSSSKTVCVHSNSWSHISYIITTWCWWTRKHVDHRACGICINMLTINLRVRLSCIDSKVSCYSLRHNWQSCSFSLESIMVSYNTQENCKVTRRRYLVPVNPSE